MSKFAFEVVHEVRLDVGIRRTVDVKYQDAVGFDQGADVQEVDQDGGFADQDVGEDGGVDLAEIAREETVLYHPQN